MKQSKIFNYGSFIFHKLKLTGYTTALILDIFVHRKNFFYLNKFNYYTIGLVPISYNPNIVNYAFISSSDSIFNQLFLLRMVFLVSKKAEYSRFTKSRGAWDSFKLLF